MDLSLIISKFKNTRDKNYKPFYLLQPISPISPLCSF